MNKINLYHGSLEQIVQPEIRESNRTLDYGSGFYTTTSCQQAEAWVTRHRNDPNKPTSGYVNVYEVDLNEVRKANCLWFNGPTEDWVDFVYANRNNRSFCHNYDFVYGPVANDRVYAAFTLYESGLINKQDLIKELNVYKLVDQLLFHTEKSLNLLTFVEARKIKL